MIIKSIKILQLKEAKNKLQEAVDHSDKDFERLSSSIVASYLRLKKSNIEQANVVERFLNKTDNPFNVIYGAVAVHSNQSYDVDVIKTVASKNTEIIRNYDY